MSELYLLGWCLLGIVGFFLARCVLQLNEGCTPITIGTLALALVAMWIPPVTFLVAICEAIVYWRNKGKLKGAIKFMRKEIVNPCKWFK